MAGVTRPALPPAGATNAAPDHLPALDGLRGLAILMVLLHNFDVLEPAGRAGWSGLLAAASKLAFYLGWIGVQLFFVLSGFLITRGLLHAQGQPGYFRDFYVKRVLRIFPLYWAALLLFTELLPGLGLAPPPPDRGGTLWLWLHLANWTIPFSPHGSALPHFWSLAVEEQFYLFWPLLLWRLKLRDVWLLCLLLMGASPLLRALLIGQGLPAEAIYEFTVTRMDALAAGAALAAWDAGRARHGATRWRLWHLQAVGLATLALGVWWSHGFQRVGDVAQVAGYSLLAVSFTAFTGWAMLCDRARQRGGSVGRQGRWLRSGLLRSFGRYSYAIYIFHKPLHDLVGAPLLARLTGSPVTADPAVAFAYIAAATAAVWVVGWLSWHLFERHFLAMRHLLLRETPPAPARPAEPRTAPGGREPPPGVPVIRGTVTAAQRRAFRAPAGLWPGSRGRRSPRR